ncbi:LOW QUALITY PROTEIN: hypothetical protein KUTeg_002743 [Tegillarca granosa]|uniref:Reverse transcriptase domain-containing protein n=1 Tax=Tegillarca granosa TaxID=220873 RepID=A0ABQ9FR40_TEGGR|nr:LOW QUALITY PROTEIN: hypothetical protein KUTeg_002743 [Tegillarca granosa]
MISDDKDINTIETDGWMETITVNNTDITFQLDTGAKCNVLSNAKFKSTGLKFPVRKPDIPLRSYSGHLIKTLGFVNLMCFYKEGDVLSVIGAKTCKEMGLLKRVNAITQSTPALYQGMTILSDDIEQQYSDLFTGLGCLPGTHTIRVDESVPPVIHPPRKIPIALRDCVKTELDRIKSVLLSKDATTRWVNSMVTVIKPNGKIRICIDPRDLNRAIMREHFLLKTVEVLVAQMPDSGIFSRIDAVSGFWQLRLVDTSSQLCTFNTPFGRYRFVRVPFGIKSAPEVSQKTRRSVARVTRSSFIRLAGRQIRVLTISSPILELSGRDLVYRWLIVQVP